MVVALNFGINSAFNKGRLILGKIQQCNVICATDQDLNFHFPYSRAMMHRGSTQMHFPSETDPERFLEVADAGFWIATAHALILAKI